MSIFGSYMEQFDPVQHLVHGPTVKRNLTHFYTQLQQGEPVEPNRSVLPLTVFASAAAFWGLGQCSSSLFSSSQVAASVAISWLRTAMDVLEHVRRSASASLETVQASIIAIFLIYNIEGLSPKVRALAYSALCTAKDLKLHRTDDPSCMLQAASQAEVVDLEVRRRVWWHLASTDWSLALAGGPHEGTYNVNPKHMRVKRPRNISDEELESKPADFDHPSSEPTIMAYYLQRIRLSEICRDVADLLWAFDADEVSVGDIKATDAKFDVMLTELPMFLRWDEGNRTGYEHIDSKDVHMRLQRYTVHLMTHSRRCKFHLPFLLRASVDAEYAFSREACLRAARTVIQVQRELSREPRSLWIVNSRLCCILHLVFYATVALVMDLSVNRDADSGEARKKEIQEACNTLEGAKQQSAAAGMFLESLMAVMRKHQIKLKNHEGIEIESPAFATGAAEASALAPGFVDVFDGAQMNGEVSNNFEFEEIWQTYIDMDSSMDPQSWDALISDIENIYQGD
ncbi:hypothetical protein LTR37_010369 [Vermiconidia calcicola]|uniref:Uncharacterized protein n=1 Tax=Vermiconidia calcicola TaxID=1690605 RepID=A0ACC3N544_9PEZI|nr:hypothetical protein LTR37_010369 [Vermiconidia calcicola]